MTPNPPKHYEEESFLIAGNESREDPRPFEAIERRVPDGDEEEKAGRQRMVNRLRYLWGQRQAVLRLTCAGLVLSALIAFVIPRRYQSSARLMPPDQAGSTPGIGMLAAASGSAGGAGLGSLAGGILGLKSSGALFIGILQSRTVQGDIVKQFQLQKIYGERYAEDARKELASNSAAFEDRKSGIITIQVTDADPVRASAITQAYTEELNRVVNLMSTSSAHREREFLGERLKAVQTDLEAAEKEFSQFSSKNGAIDIQAQGKAMIEGAATLQGQLIAAQSELQGLKQVYTDDNVRVRSLHAQISELRTQLDRIGGKNESSNTATGESKSAPDYPSMRRLPLLGVAYADLYRRMKVQEVVFETLTREYELAKVQEVKETPSVKVLDPASIPEQRSFPPRLLIISIGTFTGFAAGMTWLVLNTIWNETDSTDPRRLFAAEVFQGTMSKLLPRSLGESLTGMARRTSWGRSSNRAGVSREHD